MEDESDDASFDEKNETPQPTRKSTRKRKSTTPADTETNPEQSSDAAEQLNEKAREGTFPQKKRAVKAYVADLSKYSAVICDIEGTTTPISFVKDKLFPYARAAVDSFLERHWAEAETQADIEALRTQAKDDKQKGVPGAVQIPSAESSPADVRAAAVAYVHALMNADRKVTALKALQGHIWREGYAAGKLHGELFADVPDALRQWHKHKLKLYIYSSGSIEAQKLLFGFTHVGSLLDLFSGHFDTTTGDKKSAASYSSIVNTIGLSSTPHKALFLTDVYAEAVAAKAAGLDTVILVREGNAPLPADSTFPTATSFDDFQLSDHHERKDSSPASASPSASAAASPNSKSKATDKTKAQTTTAAGTGTAGHGVASPSKAKAKAHAKE